MSITIKDLEPVLKALGAIEARLTKLERGAATSQLPNASVQGSLNVTDEDGNVVQTIGIQDDGTVGTVTVSGPIPDKPSAPTVTVGQLELKVAWDGTLIDTDGDGSAVASDFSHVEIHLSETPGFTPDDNTYRKTLTGVGETVISPLAEVPYYVALVTVSKAGMESEASDIVGPFTPDAVLASEIEDGIVTTLKLADDAVTKAKVAVGAIEPVALSPVLADSVSQHWTDSFEDPDAWSIVASDTGFHWDFVSESTAPSGGKVGQATGYVTIRGTSPIVYDPNTIYRVSARVRTKTDPTTGVTPNSCYVGLMGLADDKVTLVNRTGANSSNSQFYVAASGASLPASSGWTVFTGYAKGRSSTPPSSPANDIQSPATLHDNVRYVVPYLWFNYANHDPSSVMQADSFVIEALRTGVVTAAELQANSVIAGKIATNAVTAGTIAANSIQAGNFAAGSIATNDLAANAITGAKIAGLTITGDKIAANQITAGHLVAGTITADKLDVNALIGKTAQSSNFVNDPEQGITGWQLNADGSVYIRSATIGNQLYEINETGNAKFQQLSVSDIFVDGEDFEGLVDQKPRGILNVYPLTGAITYTTTNEYLVTKFVIPAIELRMYRLILDNFKFDRGSGTSSPTLFSVDVYQNYGSAATNASYNSFTYARGAGYSPSTSDDIWTSEHVFSPPDANVGQDLYVAVYTSVNGGLGNTPRLEMTANSRIIVEDVGGKVVYAPTVDISTTPTSKTTYTKTYTSIWMGSWGSANGKRTDENAYQGNYSGTWGNNYSKYGFSSSIATDLSGATVKSVELYLDNNHFYNNSGGNAIIGTHPNVTESTGSSSTSGTFARQSIAFNKGQAKWVTLSSAFGTDFKSGAATGITLGRTSGGSLAEYGYFSNTAKLRITYEK